MILAWYAPGAALPSNVHILCYSGFDLFDFIAVDLKICTAPLLPARRGVSRGDHGDGVCGCEGCRVGDLKMHNRLALTREISLITRFIADQQMPRVCRGTVDGCRQDTWQSSAISTGTTPLSSSVCRWCGSGRLGAMSGEALQRPEVVRFATRVVGRYIPPAADVAVLLPCSARKPYSISQSHRKFSEVIGGRALECRSSPLPSGLVPRELRAESTLHPTTISRLPVTGTGRSRVHCRDCRSVS